MDLLQKSRQDKKGRTRAKPALGRAKPIFLEDVGVPELLSACRKLQARWRLDAETTANLLGTSRSTWFRWQEALDHSKEIRLTGDQRTRVIALLRIFEAIADLHHDDRDADSWIHEPLDGPGFSGHTPLEVMTSNFEGLLSVRDYLNFLHGAWT